MRSLPRNEAFIPIVRSVSISLSHEIIWFRSTLNGVKSGTAIADYDRAIKINPRFSEAYSNRGNALQDKGELGGSIADYESAIKIDPSFAKAYGNRGLARLSQGDIAEAEKDFDACLRLDPKLKRSLQEQIEHAKRRLGTRH